MTLEATTNVNQTADAGRQANGQFKLGNRGGPGNPNAAKVAKFRQIVLDMASEDDMRSIARKLVEMALEGNWQAIKLVLLYTCGKPERAQGIIEEYYRSGQAYRDGFEDAPSPNGVFQEAPSANGDIKEVPPSANGVLQEAPPSANGVLQEAPPSANGDSSRPLNRQQRRALRKQYRLEKQKRNTPKPVTQTPAT